MLFNINTLTWDKDILAELDIPESMLPSRCRIKLCHMVIQTQGIFWKCRPPIAGAAGDQQAALFGQTCFSEWRSEEYIWYRLFPVDEYRRTSGIFRKRTGHHHCLGAVGKVNYALEGSIFVAGAGNPVAA